MNEWDTKEGTHKIHEECILWIAVWQKASFWAENNNKKA